IEEALLSVKLCQLQHALKRRLELADLLVHGDSLDRESLGGIGVAHTLKTVRGLVVIAHAGVEVSHGVTHREILGIILEDLAVLSDGILQLALLDILLRSAEDLLFIEPETERHRYELQPLVLSRKLRTIPGKHPRENICGNP